MVSQRAEINAALRSVLSKRPKSLTAMRTIDRFEAQKQSDIDERGMVLVAVALLEQLLEDAILASCLKAFEVPPLRDKLFGGVDGGGVASTFAGKIVLGHALGIYGEKMREDLDRLRRIRNAFAHAKGNLTLKSPAIRRALVFHVMAPDGGDFGSLARSRSRRGKFLGAIGFYMIVLHVLRDRHKHYRPRNPKGVGSFIYASLGTSSQKPTRRRRVRPSRGDPNKLGSSSQPRS